MLVRQVRQFIASLSQLDNLSESDAYFLAELQEKYQTLVIDDPTSPQGETLIPQADIDWLVELIARRWQKVAGSYDDYTLDSRGNNAPWVTFAQDLAPDVGKFYAQILMPTLVNIRDPNDLSRLSEIPDTRSIYISENNTWHRLWALCNEMEKQGGVFGILDKPKNLRPRALTLDELKCISSKRGGEELIYIADGVSYPRAWEFLLDKAIPNLQPDRADLTELLPEILQVVEKYFVAQGSGDFSDFRRSFKLFKVCLSSSSLLAVNGLYGSRIDVNGNKYFLVEILLECMQDDLSNLEAKLLAVAKWVCEKNPSLISQNKSLEPVYEDLKVGFFFDLQSLLSLVCDLKVESSSILKPLHTRLLIFIRDKIEFGVTDERAFRAEFVNRTRKMYTRRWDAIIDSSLDYTRLQNGVNSPWIRLAQYLAGAGLISTNYYRFLIPTLRHDKDPVTGEPVTNYPLHQYVLSTTGDRLIFLPNCVQHYKVNGTFFNCNYREPEPFSSVEEKRVAFAYPPLYEYFRKANKHYEDPPLSRRTIEEIRKLVNGSLNPSGLTSHLISPTEYDAATRGYDRFVVYINEISEEERNNLFRQRIKYRNTIKTVRELLDSVQSARYNDRECVAGWGKYLAKLVMDYAPEMRFRDEIERNVEITNMRLCSAKKVYSEFNELTEKAAVNYLLTIVSSLMTHSFQCLWLTGYTISFDKNYSNTVTETGKNIFNYVNKHLQKGDLSQSRFLFAQLFDYIVAPSVDNKPSSLSRYPDTKRWLKDILNGEMFNWEKEQFFDPELILTALWSRFNTYSPRQRVAIEVFLDELLEILISPNNQYKKWVLVNIEFTRFLGHQAIQPKSSQLLDLIRAKKQEDDVSQELVIRCSKAFFVHRLAQCGAKDPEKRSVGLFGKAPGDYADTYKYLKSSLTKQLEYELKKMGDKQLEISDLISKLQLIVSRWGKRGPINLSYMTGVAHKNDVETRPRVPINCT